MSLPRRIEGYAVVSEDGMLADASGAFPPALKVEADQRFFERGLDAADAVLHGRNSHERQMRSALRPRLVLTRRIPAISRSARNSLALFWNPSGASFEDAWDALGLGAATLAVIGGTEVFGMFLDRYDRFYLSRVPGVRLPGGRPVFPDVPRRTPEAIMAEHGLAGGDPQMLDARRGVTVTPWDRKTAPGI
ncbi:MAG: dihydrofolate reductase family protein [Dongiaceae bacterium]